MSKSLDLYSSNSDLGHAAGNVGLLCEFAPDSPCLQGIPNRYGPDELLGPADEALPVAHSLVSKLLRAAPPIEGVPLLSIFEEELLEQVSYIVRAFHLDRWISGHGFSSCRFVGASPWLDRLRKVRAVQQSSYALDADLPPLHDNLYARYLFTLWKARPSPSELFRRVAPLWSRWFGASRARRRIREVPHGGIWFYSTAYTYTKIALAYEPYLPQRLNFLVEDPGAGGKHLRQIGREYDCLYAWARASDIPAISETGSIADRLTAAVADLPLTKEENALRSVLLDSEWWRLFRIRGLPLALFYNRALQRWFQAVAPEMIVVGNAVHERGLLLYEGADHVPAVMLQHGIMHWIYGVSDQPVDYFLLRGPFFRRVINEALRRRTVLQNFPEPNHTPQTRPEQRRQDVLFITTPYNVPALFHPADLRDILRSLVRVSHTNGRRLTIRIHPLEDIAYYRSMVGELQEDLGLRGEVAYSQGIGAEDVLLRSQVAVLHFSTMFLDCLRHGIPMISFGWHWFPNRKHFEGIFNFAADLRSFEDLLQRGIEGQLAARRDGLEEFLAPAHPEEITDFFRGVWSSRGNFTSQRRGHLRESADKAFKSL